MINHAAVCDLLSTALTQVASNLGYPGLDFYWGERWLFSPIGNVRICDMTAVIYLTKGYVLVELGWSGIFSCPNSFETGSYDNAKNRSAADRPSKSVCKT
ncbi:MAG: hypothetical protein COA78_11030 [Blastopirellula sp.]|nr:MAG: hypothetical protein COA78_11030 [Blastopirellula sp.]